MTIIAACRDSEGNVWMGSDSISLHRDSEVKLLASSKVFRLGEIVIGLSGTVRCRQIIRYLTDIPPVPSECDLNEWLVREFAHPLRVAMKEHGGECKNRSGDQEMDGRLLIGARGQIFEMDVNYAIWPHRNHFAAIGCADQEAVAAMLTALRLVPDMHARMVVQCGLDAAAELDINIRPPFEIICSHEESVAALSLVG